MRLSSSALAVALALAGCQHPSPAPAEQHLYHGHIIDEGPLLTFTPCDSDQRFLLTGPRQQQLNKTVRQNQAAPGQPLLVELHGQTVLQPGSTAASTEQALRVTRYQPIPPRPDCQLASASLRNTYWRLSYLGRDATTPPANQQREDHLLLNAAGQVRGYSGGTPFNGRFHQQQQQLRFSNINRDADNTGAPDAINPSDFLLALQNSRTFLLNGHTLTLLDTNGHPVASLVAIHLF